MVEVPKHVRRESHKAALVVDGHRPAGRHRHLRVGEGNHELLDGVGSRHKIRAADQQDFLAGLGEVVIDSGRLPLAARLDQEADPRIRIAKPSTTASVASVHPLATTMISVRTTLVVRCDKMASSKGPIFASSLKAIMPIEHVKS